MTEVLTLRECPACHHINPSMLNRTDGEPWHPVCPMCGTHGPNDDPSGYRWNQLPRRADLVSHQAALFAAFQSFAAWAETAQKIAFQLLLYNDPCDVDWPVLISIARQHIECHPHPHSFISALAGGHPEDPESWPVLHSITRLQLLMDFMKGS